MTEQANIHTHTDTQTHTAIEHIEGSIKNNEGVKDRNKVIEFVKKAKQSSIKSMR